MICRFAGEGQGLHHALGGSAFDGGKKRVREARVQPCRTTIWLYRSGAIGTNAEMLRKPLLVRPAQTSKKQYPERTDRAPSHGSGCTSRWLAASQARRSHREFHSFDRKQPLVCHTWLNAALPRNGDAESAGFTGQISPWTVRLRTQSGLDPFCDPFVGRAGLTLARPYFSVSR